MVKSKDSPVEEAKKIADDFEKSVKGLSEFTPAQAQSQTDLGMSQKEISRSQDIYLKPVRSITDNQSFDEKYRDDFEFQSQYVSFVADHKEIIGEKIEIWTKKFKGKPAEFWEVPPGKVVWGPRYLAEQIAKCSYRRLKMEQQVLTGEHGSFTHGLAVDTTINRLEATPVNKGKKSIFMGA